MGKKITFGKFQGWNTDELARAGEIGRKYLYWGSQNLRSPMWAREFGRALQENQGLDEHLAAQAMVLDCMGSIDYDEARRIIREDIAEQAEMDAMLASIEARQSQVCARWAGTFDKSPAELRGLAHRFESELDYLSEKNFSSPQICRNFMAFMAEWMAAYDD